MANPCSLQVFELLWTKHQNPSSHAFGTHDICVWHQAPKWRTPLLERCTSSKYSQILALPVRGQKEATQIYWGLLIKMLQFSLKKSQQFFWVHLDCTCNVGIEDSFRNNSVEIINSIQLGKTNRNTWPTLWIYDSSWKFFRPVFQVVYPVSVSCIPIYGGYPK